MSGRVCQVQALTSGVVETSVSARLWPRLEPWGDNDPLACAAEAGWSISVVCDRATSQKFPAQFAVLTRTVARGDRCGLAGGFGAYPSVRAMGSGGDTITMGFDTEFVAASDVDPERGWIGENTDVGREIVSYQAAVIDPTDDTRLRLAIVVPMRYEGPRGPRVARLSFETFVETMITALGLHEHPLAVGWTDKGVRRQEIVDDEGRPDWGQWFRAHGGVSRALPITLVAHWQHADLTTFVDKRKLHNTWNDAYPGRSRRVSDRAGSDGRRARWLNSVAPDILRAVISASGGMVSPKPVHMVLDGGDWRWARPVAISIRDTMAQSGADSLRTLGEAVGVPKLEVDGDWITRMDEYFVAHPVEFLDYGANDAVIALEYVSQIYGDNKEVGLTLPTASARAMREAITREVGAGLFNPVFGGLQRVAKNVEATTGVENQLAFYKKRELQPVDGAAATWIHASACAFRGGYNMCAEVGVFPEVTHDLDLQGCYPTSSSTIWDVDYLHPGGVIARTVNNVTLSLSDFDEGGPLTPFVGFVSFEFPANVAFPCLPVPVDGSMVYPRTSGGARGVWATAPEVWLALKLGARVVCQIGHFGRTLRCPDGSPSRLLRGAYKQLINDRARAKKEFGSKSFQQSVLKLMANAGYGKLSQGVLGQRGWDAWAQERDEVGGSAISSPWHASMTTGLVRAVLLAVLNELHDLGYSTPSCTTDGFITNAELSVVDGLDLFGLGELWRESRQALSGSRSMWEEKHTQSDLLNITTRANASRQPSGVLAHGGFKLPEGIEKGSQADRDFMYDLLVTRDGPVPSTMQVFPSMAELTRIENRLDFVPHTVTRQLTIEFDRKRRPVRDGMTAHTVVVDGVEYEVAHVQTVAWETPEQVTLGRSVDKGLKKFDPELGEPVWTRSPVRRTRDQWNDYFTRLETLLDDGGQIAEAERLDRIAKGIVIAHRQEIIHIPWLSCARPLADRLDAFEDFGLPRPKERFWTHARSKTERQIEVPLDDIAPYVDEMLAVDPFDQETATGTP